MEEKNRASMDEFDIDLGRIFRSVLDRSWLVAIVAVLCALIVFVGTFFFVTPKYEAAAMFYVNNNSLSVADASFSISSGDLSTSRNLVKSYLVILNTRETLDSVLDYAGVDQLTYMQLGKMLTAGAVNETEIFQVVVTSTDPGEAEKLANAIAYILPKRIDTIIDGTSAKIVSSAVRPSRPSSPSFTKNTLIGFLAGLLLSVGAIALKEVFDITIRGEEDIARISKLPILAAVPDMMSPGKGSYYCGNGKKQEKQRKQAVRQAWVGDDLPFAATEAYKLLRAKFQYSFSDEKTCHGIGVSSALSGEGKSTTSINLSHALAQAGQRVLLIDCDLRRPSVATKLKLSQEYGLSGFLTRQVSLEQIAQECRMKHGGVYYVIAAGRIPPNPTELLNSVRMEKMIERMAQEFDYIILDLPPVEEVSDALVAAKLADGVLLTVRQDYCNRPALEDTIKQFDFVNGRILGLLMTYAQDRGLGYGKSYYKHYYHRYGKYRHYAKSYEEAYHEQQNVGK